MKALKDALNAQADTEFTARSTLEDAARGWLQMFEGLVERGSRSPSTLDEYRHILARVIVPGVGSLRLGEVSTPRHASTVSCSQCLLTRATRPRN